MQNDVTGQGESNLSSEEIVCYLKGTSTSEERAAIETLMQQDEMTKDAIEGLKQVSSIDNLAVLTKDLNSSIFQKSGISVPKAKIINISSAALKPILAVAASIVVCVGTYFIFIDKENPKKDVLSDNRTNVTVKASKNDTYETNHVTSDTKAINVANKTSSKEDAIQNQSYIDQLDSANLKIGSVETPPTNNIYGVLSSSNIMNPMKNLVPNLLIAQAQKNEEKNLSLDLQEDRSGKQVLKGQVLDNTSKLPLSGAKVIIDGNIQTTTNASGYYEIALNTGVHQIVCTQDGYEIQSDNVGIEKEKLNQFNVFLNQDIIAMNGVEAKYESRKESEAATASSKNSSVAGNSVSLEESANNLKIGLDNYTTHNFANAVVYLNKALETEPNNKDALFYAGMANYNLGNTNQSVSYYNKLISVGGKYHEDAMWYKSQVLIRQKKKEEAKAILEKLVGTKYDEKASNLLQTLDQ